jgi:hypothetical protein
MWGPTEQLVHPGRKLVYPKNWTIDPAKTLLAAAPSPVDKATRPCARLKCPVLRIRSAAIIIEMTPIFPQPRHPDDKDISRPHEGQRQGQSADPFPKLNVLYFPFRARTP